MNLRTRFTQVRAWLVPAMMIAAPLLSASAAEAATYYVSTSGNDTNAGTQDSPWRTLRYAAARLGAGDTLFIRQGTYSSADDIFDSQRCQCAFPSGNSWSDAITIAGYPGETVTIRPPSGYGAIGMTTGAPHYLIFQDLTLDGSLQSDPGNPIVWEAPELIYVANGSHHIRFQRLDVGNCMSTCIHFSTHMSTEPFAAYNEFLNSTIHHAGQATGDNGHGGPGINTGYGVYSFTDGNQFDGNTFRDNNAYALNVYGSDNVIRNNRIYNNGLRGGSTWGINIGSTAFSGRSANNLVYNNLVYNNRYGGIKIYTNADNTGVYNNTVYGNALYGVMAQYYGVNNVVRNNIIYANGSNYFDAGGSGVIQADHNLMSDPGFIDAASANFVLKPGSAAVDSGANVDGVTTDVAGLPRPQGLGFDVGANELGTSYALLTAPKNLRVMN
jgi:parallel beta-helix repeat protein